VQENTLTEEKRDERVNQNRDAAGLFAVSTTALALAQSGTVGTGGSAAVGGTSASTLGTGGTSTGSTGTSSTIGSAGNAAAVEGKTSSRTNVHGNDNMLQGQSKAKAQDGGTWSKSQTKTKVKAGESLDSRTKSMAHEPGSKPVKSTTRSSVDLPQ